MLRTKPGALSMPVKQPELQAQPCYLALTIQANDLNCHSSLTYHTMFVSPLNFKLLSKKGKDRYCLSASLLSLSLDIS